jgi:hypothetical protein
MRNIPRFQTRQPRSGARSEAVEAGLPACECALRSLAAGLLFFGLFGLFALLASLNNVTDGEEDLLEGGAPLRCSPE